MTTPYYVSLYLNSNDSSVIKNSNKNLLTFSGIDLKQALGSLYDDYDYFSITPYCVNSIQGTGGFIPVDASNNKIMSFNTFNAYLQGLDLYNCVGFGIHNSEAYLCSAVSSYNSNSNLVQNGLVFCVDANNYIENNTNIWQNIGTGNSQFNVSLINALFIQSSTNSNNSFSFNSTASISYGSLNRPIQDDFSICIWFRTTQNAGGILSWVGSGAKMFGGDGPGTVNDFGMGMTQGGRIIFGTGNPDVSVYTTAQTYNDGVYHYAVGTRNRSTGELQIYIDGSLNMTTTGNTNSLTANSILRIGLELSGVGKFVGNIGVVQAYNRVLSSEEILQNYNSLLERLTPNPVNTIDIITNSIPTIIFRKQPIVDLTIKLYSTNNAFETKSQANNGVVYPDMIFMLLVHPKEEEDED